MSIDTDYPRTLIVGAHFTEQSGSGIYVGRLFCNWPIDHLATLCNGNLVPNWKHCTRHFRTGGFRFPLNVLLNPIFPFMRSGPVLPSAVVAFPKPPATIPARSFPKRLFTRQRLQKFFHLLGGRELLCSVALSPLLLGWVRSYKPEVLYGHCSDLHSVLLLRRLQKTLGLPLVLHFMDDWVNTNYHRGWIAKIFRTRFQSEFRALVHSASVCVAICREMAEEYESRHQRKILWLPMPVDIVAYQGKARNQWTAGKPFSLRYGGRVDWAVRDSLVDIAQAVHSLRKGGADIVLNLATFQMDQLPVACRNLSGVEMQIPGVLTDLPRLQAEVDVLVICYDFDSISFQQAQYSMPSKMADCMASGTPILVYGPAGLPVVEYARREGWGMVVDQRDPIVLQNAVRELLESSRLREQLGRTAKRLAAKCHDAKVVSEEMRRIIATVAGNLMQKPNEVGK